MPGPGDPPSVDVEADPLHSVTTTTVNGANDLRRRLFWKELLPEE